MFPRVAVVPAVVNALVEGGEELAFAVLVFDAQSVDVFGQEAFARALVPGFATVRAAPDTVDLDAGPDVGGVVRVEQYLGCAAGRRTCNCR